MVSSSRDRARLRGLGGSISSQWLTTIPAFPPLTLTDFEVRTSLRLYLGLRQPPWPYEMGSPCPLCSQMEDTADFGAHLLASCPAVQGARTRRHTRLLSLLLREIRPVVRQVGLEIECEKPLPIAALCQNEERRVADLVITCDDSRRTTYVDLAVPNPQASRYLPTAGERRGFAAASMRRHKEVTYARALSTPEVRASALA
eukprot:CAMPEP_0184752662 /NCGR_PEP_ID=MMETSP0315-20130426/43699_1 /TAXON_ID=101924 /ORGANISM="Rhodosorus marinus, Strain UTEX LB 2760" /LENGTH=200 /DNA_ID=CAMNT_0027232009 /DNA_START=469 /DNA_END=1067 /DNA_ORIENTATION=-